LSNEDCEVIFTDALNDEFEEYFCTTMGIPNPGKRMKRALLKNPIQNRLESRGNRYTEEVHRLTHDILQAAGAKALSGARKELPLPPCQTNTDRKPAGDERSGLTAFSLWNTRLRDWTKNCNIPDNQQAKAVLSIDAICFRPQVIVSEAGIMGMDLTGLNVGEDFEDELPQD
jgi:hypothetical protein